MTRRFFALTVLLFAALAPLAAADVRFVAPCAEVGAVRAGVPLTHVFVFTNDGSEAVTLTELRPGCGCLQPRVHKRVFAPGERGEIFLEMRMLGQAAGPHRWDLTVAYTDGATSREQKLEVSGNVITEVSVQPAAVTLCGEGPLTYDVRLTDLRDFPLAITSVTTTTPSLRVQAAHLEHDALGHWTARIRLETVGGLPEGRQEEFLTIYTSDPLYSELKIPVTLIHRASTTLSATPAEVMLSAGPRLVRLRDSQGRPVVIERATVEDARVVCTWAAGPDNDATLRLQADRATTADGLQTRVLVEVSSPVRQVVTIPVVVPGN